MRGRELPGVVTDQMKIRTDTREFAIKINENKRIILYRTGYWAMMNLMPVKNKRFIYCLFIELQIDVLQEECQYRLNH